MVWTGRIELPTSGSRSRRSTELSHVQMVWLPGAAPGASRAQTGCSPDELEPGCLLRAEGGTRTRTPFVGTRLSTWRVYRSTTSALTVGRADQSLLGVPTPATAGTSGGYAPAQEARQQPVPGNNVSGVVRKARFALARPEGHRLLGPACLRSITSAYGRLCGQSLPGVSTPGPGGTKAGSPPGREAQCRRGDLHPHALDGAPGFGPGVSAFHHVGRCSAGGSAPVVVVPRTGIEPVISSLRGRRVGHSTNGALLAGAGHPQLDWSWSGPAGVEPVGLEPTASSLQERCSS